MQFAQGFLHSGVETESVDLVAALGRPTVSIVFVVALSRLTEIMGPVAAKQRIQRRVSS